jgi:hypothetical protein
VIPDNMTKREYAYDKMLLALRMLHKETGTYASNEGLTEREARKVQERIAKEHNRLLDESGLDGTAL